MNITELAMLKKMTGNGSGNGGASVELDTTLTKAGKAADAKAVGNALSKKVDIVGSEATDEEVINLIAQRNIAVPVTDETNCVYTDENEKILVI